MAGRVINAQTLAALQSKSVGTFFALSIAFDNDSLNNFANRFRIWSGRGNISFTDSTGVSQTFLGGGALLNVNEVTESINLNATNFTFSLSGLYPGLLGSLLSDSADEDEQWQGNPIEFYVGTLDLTANNQTTIVGDPMLMFRGKLSTATISVTARTISVGISCESALIRMNKSKHRKYTVNDQQTLNRDIASAVSVASSGSGLTNGTYTNVTAASVGRTGSVYQTIPILKLPILTVVVSGGAASSATVVYGANGMDGASIYISNSDIGGSGGSSVFSVTSVYDDQSLRFLNTVVDKTIFWGRTFEQRQNAGDI